MSYEKLPSEPQPEQPPVAVQVPAVSPFDMPPPTVASNPPVQLVPPVFEPPAQVEPTPIVPQADGTDEAYRKEYANVTVFVVLGAFCFWCWLVGFLLHRNSSFPKIRKMARLLLYLWVVSLIVQILAAILFIVVLML